MATREALKRAQMARKAARTYGFEYSALLMDDLARATLPIDKRSIAMDCLRRAFNRGVAYAERRRKREAPHA